jgi:hypothetical protein
MSKILEDIVISYGEFFVYNTNIFQLSKASVNSYKYDEKSGNYTIRCSIFHLDGDGNIKKQKEEVKFVIFHDHLQDNKISHYINVKMLMSRKNKIENYLDEK